MSDLTIEDYEEVLQSHNRLVRELDVLLNGEEGAAKQASLCDLVGQVKGIVSKRGGLPLLSSPWPGLTTMDEMVQKINVIMKDEAPDEDGKQLILNNLSNIDDQLDALADFPVENSAQVMIGDAKAMLTETIELVKELKVAVVNIVADIKPK